MQRFSKDLDAMDQQLPGAFGQLVASTLNILGAMVSPPFELIHEQLADAIDLACGLCGDSYFLLRSDPDLLLLLLDHESLSSRRSRAQALRLD
jgi:hypothetical protein